MDNADRENSGNPACRARAELALGRYVLRFRMLEAATLPDFSGGMWRGVFGKELKAMSEGRAPAPAGEPPDIPPARLYEYFFETPPPENAALLRRAPRAPHPYVLAAPFHDSPIHLRPGDEINLPVTLIGHAANRLLAAVLLAFARAAGAGLGRGRGRARLVEALEETGAGADMALRRVFALGKPARAPLAEMPPPPQAPPFVMVDFRTPLRMTLRGRLMKPEDFSAGTFVMNVARRVSLLEACHGSGAPRVDFRRLRQTAHEVRLAGADLHWRDQTHWSARARRELPFGGVVGRVALDLRAAPGVWPWLWAGQFVHAGKAAAYGLGAYRLSWGAGG